MNEMTESPFAGKPVTDSAGSRQNQSREVAETQTKYWMAAQLPRDQVKAMDGILNAFSRTRLAEKAQYAYSKGGNDIRGPSIKAMEAIATEWGNLDYGWRVIGRTIDPRGYPVSEIEAFAVDLQTRTQRRIQFPVPHWRDRSEQKGGGYLLTDEREVYELTANMAQRRVRSCLEAVIPSDVTETAMDQADVTLKAHADTSAEAMEKMLAAFEPFGVAKEHIEKRIQRRLSAIQAAQVVSLKRIYASLRDGMSDASEWFDMTPPETVGPDAREEVGKDKSRTYAVKTRIRTGKKKNAPPPAQAQPVPFAQVADQMNAAKKKDDLDVAADLIKYVPDEGQRAELTDLFMTLATKFEDKG